MRFTEMKNGLPKRENHKLAMEFKEFINMNVKVARVDFAKDDYKTPTVAANVLRLAAKRHNVPVKVSVREGIVYFVRTDM